MERQLIRIWCNDTIGITLEFKLADLWVGVFWKNSCSLPGFELFHMWICIVPCLPIHVTYLKRLGKFEDV